MNPTLEQAVRLATLLAEIVVILAPVLIAFYLKDKDALKRAIEAVPDVYRVVLRERTREGGLEIAKTDPMGMALSAMATAFGNRVVQKNADLFRLKIQATHDLARLNGEVE